MDEASLLPPFSEDTRSQVTVIRHFDRQHDPAGATLRTETLSPKRRMPSDAVEPSVDPDRYTDFLYQIESEQETLRDDREDLLGARVRLEVNRQELVKVRHNAAEKAGIALDLLRKYLLRQSLGLPAHIDSALEEADAARNALGTREFEYDEAEKDYNQREWRYTAKETQFVLDLRRSAPTQMRPKEANPALDENDHSAGFSFGLSDVARISYGPNEIAHMVAQSAGARPINLDATDVSYEVDDDLQEWSYFAQTGADVQVSQTEHVEALAPPTMDYEPHLHLRTTNLRRSDELGLDMRWTATHQSIDRWLFSVLECSAFEKLRLSNERDSNRDEDWWELTCLHWFEDSPLDVVFHTGDTTVSYGSRRYSNSVTTMPQPYSEDTSVEMSAQVLPFAQSLGQDQFADSLALFEFPADIEPRDLIDTRTSPQPSRPPFRPPGSSGPFEHPGLPIPPPPSALPPPPGSPPSFEPPSSPSLPSPPEPRRMESRRRARRSGAV